MSSVCGEPAGDRMRLQVLVGNRGGDRGFRAGGLLLVRVLPPFALTSVTMLTGGTILG
jgi:hypothetical protein